MIYLIGDIGGTKTHLALLEDSETLRDQKFPSGNYSDLYSIVQEFLGGEKLDIQVACFGIAGPVRDGSCRATNLPWVVDSQALSQKLGIPKVHLMNDLEANAWGLNALNEDQFHVLNKGDPKSKGNQCLISAGTGLGEAGIYFDGKAHHPFATEGGHTDFAPRSEIEDQLLIYLRQKFERVSYERVLSGPGLADIYRFLVDTKRGAKTFDVSEDELPKVVSDKGLDGCCATCGQALEIFTSLYGAEAGNLALKCLALGGIFVGGGIAPKILPEIDKGQFLASLIDKGRFSDLLQTISVKVVLEEHTALLGAGCLARLLSKI